MMKTIYWISLFAFVFFSCGTPKVSGYNHLTATKERKLKQAYNLPINWRFYRESDTINKYYFEINPSLFLTKYDSLGKAKTDFRISLEIRNNQFGGKVLYQGDKAYSRYDHLPILDSFSFSLTAEKTVFFEIRIEDLNKYTFQSIEGFYERANAFIPEDILLHTRDSNKVLTSSFIYNDSIIIRSTFEADTFRAVRYESYQKPAGPMWELKNNPIFQKIEPAKEYVVSLIELEYEVNNCKEESYFRVKPIDGETLGSFDFTKLIRKNERTIEPLIYLAREESLGYATWVKFWSNASLDEPEKAEKLIQEFNRRVEYANNYYSAHKLGWKTDRGMVYILFGPPDRVISDVRGEIWSYGFTSSVQREFLFIRNASGLHKNDYILERNLGFREIEFTAIQRWKNGWVRYSLD